MSSVTRNNAIKKAIDIVGTQSELARRTGVGQSTISKWLAGAEIRSRYITSIVTATDGKVTAYELLNSVSRR